MAVQQQLGDSVHCRKRKHRVFRLLVSASREKQTNNEITFSDGGVEERFGLRSVRSVSSKQVPAGGGGSGSGGGGAEFHPSIIFPSSSCRLHQVGEQSDPLLKELQHFTVLLLDVSWRKGGGGGGAFK